MGPLISFFLSLCVSQYAHSQSPTYTAPSGEQSTCKVMSESPELLELMGKPNEAPQEVYRQQGRVCRVCCEDKPNVCYTSDWQQGICISVKQCPNIANLLRPPVPDDIRRYVQNNKCQGPDKYSVCCAERGPKEPPANLHKCSTTHAPVDPRTYCCGQDASHGGFGNYEGGNVAEIDQYPWLALIEYAKDNRIRVLCGGTLISGRYVLTAGHCVAGGVLEFGTPVNVRLGEYDTSKEGLDCITVEGGGEDCTEGTNVVPIEQIILHPEYQIWENKHDIALIRLKQMVQYTDFIRPICLPTVDITSSPPDRLIFYTAGWGVVNATGLSSQIKQQDALPYRTLESCEDQFRTNDKLTNETKLWKGQLCAGGVKNQDSCKGDSGGPLMYKGRGRYEIIGVVSLRPKVCGTENIPGVYTKVYEYNSWIRTSIKP